VPESESGSLLGLGGVGVPEELGGVRRALQRLVERGRIEQQTISIPADATDVVVVVEIQTFPPDTWTTVSTLRFAHPVTKSYELSGMTSNPTLEEG
jgi:hypothetical protein